MRIVPGLRHNAAAVSSAALLAMSLGSCGEGKEINDKPTAIKKAEAVHAKKFLQASKAAKFTLNYLQKSKVVIRKDKERFYRVYFGNACLKNTPYDINPKYIEGSISGVSLTGSVKGKIKGQIPGLQASIVSNPENPDNILVTPADRRLPELDLALSESTHRLNAANGATQDQLDFYKCNTGISKITIGHE